jgi:hypothetical protein
VLGAAATVGGTFRGRKPLPQHLLTGCWHIIGVERTTINLMGHIAAILFR